MNNMGYHRAICRFFKSGRKSAILLFPDDAQPNYCVGSWEPSSGHASASRDLARITRLASAEEAARVKALYERDYRCTLKLLKRMPQQ